MGKKSTSTWQLVSTIYKDRPAKLSLWTNNVSKTEFVICIFCNATIILVFGARNIREAELSRYVDTNVRVTCRLFRYSVRTLLVGWYVYHIRSRCTAEAQVLGAPTRGCVPIGRGRHLKPRQRGALAHERACLP